jgi:hypothetical protein
MILSDCHVARYPLRADARTFGQRTPDTDHRTLDTGRMDWHARTLGGPHRTLAGGTLAEDATRGEGTAGRPHLLGHDARGSLGHQTAFLDGACGAWQP